MMCQVIHNFKAVQFVFVLRRGDGNVLLQDLIHNWNFLVDNDF